MKMDGDRAVKLGMLFAFIGLTIGAIATLVALIACGNFILCGEGTDATIETMLGGGTIGAVVGALVGGSIAAIVWIRDCFREMN